MNHVGWIFGRTLCAVLFGLWTTSVVNAQSVVVGFGPISVFPASSDVPVIAARPGAGKPVLGVVIEDALLGVKVMHVIKGSAADRAGLRKGDQIVEIDHVTIEGTDDVVAALEGCLPQAFMELVVVRHNRRMVRRFRWIAPVVVADPAVVATAPDVFPPNEPVPAASETAQLRTRLDELSRQIASLKRAVEVLASGSSVGEQVEELPPPKAEDTIHR